MNDQIQPVDLKPSDIPAGHVAVRKTDYHYGRQGQVTLAYDRTFIVPEYEALKHLGYGLATVTWPDGAMEFFDLRVTPVRHTSALPDSFGTIPGVNLSSGVQGHVSLSRLPNVAVEYYHAREITEAQRKTFIPYERD